MNIKYVHGMIQFLKAKAKSNIVIVLAQFWIQLKLKCDLHIKYYSRVIK